MSTARKPGVHCEVRVARGRVGSISVFGGQLARLACADGAWFVKKTRQDPRRLTIESADHEQAGKCLRRQWPPGWSITLTDGTRVDVRRSLPGRWKVRSADGSGCLVEVHRPVVRSAQQQQLKLMIHSLPPDATHASMFILAGCALLMLPGG